MPGDQDDVDELFGGAPAPQSPLPAKSSADSRKEARVRANWPARVLLAADRFVALNVYDLSEGGIGLISEVGIPAHSVLTIALAVPGLDHPSRVVPVSGTIKTSHMTVRGHYIHCGGSWIQLPASSRELIDQWVRRLRK
jgi:hypothetical protein